MEQLDQSFRERRRFPRQPKAFALWLRPESSAVRIGAWMLDVCVEGAAFLTSASEAPEIGERVELIEMPTRDRMVREGAGPLPRYARVLRHDEQMGLTRRIAVKFEAEQRVGLDSKNAQGITREVPLPKSGLLPPPLAEIASTGTLRLAPRAPETK